MQHHQTHFSSFPHVFTRPLSQPKPLFLVHPPTRMRKLGLGVSAIARLATEPKSTMYDLLSVNKTAGLEEIKAAYRKMAREWHPDTCRLQNKEFYTQQFIKAREAYRILSDPVLKEDYDYGLQNGFNVNGILLRRGASGKSSDFGDYESQLELLKSRSNCGNSSWASRVRAKRNQR